MTDISSFIEKLLYLLQTTSYATFFDVADYAETGLWTYAETGSWTYQKRVCAQRQKVQLVLVMLAWANLTKSNETFDGAGVLKLVSGPMR